ncbi:MAG: BON domain-containing protein [Acidobacteriota bacterium]
MPSSTPRSLCPIVTLSSPCTHHPRQRDSRDYRSLLCTLALLALALLTLIAPLQLSADEETSPPSITERLADARATLAVRGALLQKLGADSLNIEVTVEGDRAVLSGLVEERSVQELAKEVALAVDGITTVDNRIRLEGDKDLVDSTAPEIAERVGRDAEEEALDALLEVRLKVALVREMGTRALAIEVEAVDGVVSLRGQVPDSERRSVARRTAAEVDGVRKIVDLLEVDEA